MRQSDFDAQLICFRHYLASESAWGRWPDFDTASDVFGHIFDANVWNCSESRSGSGSTIQYTEGLRAQLPKLFREFKVRTLLDAPCGDFNWFRHMTVEEPFNYIGADIVPALVESNARQYGGPTREFRRLDITVDRLPSADMWLCRDCLFHLNYCQIALVVANFLDSGIPYFAASTHYATCLNFDIPSGGFRLLNLQVAPFNFPAPIEAIEDWAPGAFKRKIGVWSRRDLLHLANRLGRLRRCDLSSYGCSIKERRDLS